MVRSFQTFAPPCICHFVWKTRNQRQTDQQSQSATGLRVFVCIAMGKLISLGVVVFAVVAFYGFRDGFDPDSIRDKRILVTGASSGIGEQLAYQYAKLGARLVVTARRADLLEKVAGQCRELGAPQVESVAADMAIAADRVRLVRQPEKVLGGLDHLVLNHAVYDCQYWTGAPENMTTLQRYVEVNFLSYVHMASLAIDMLKASRGNVGVVSSVHGKMGHAMSASYAATKHALQGFFASWRQELAFRNTGVSVTLCVLGLIDTEKALDLMEKHFTGLARSVMGSAETTAAAILRSVAVGSYEMYYPWFSAVCVTLHKFFPGYLEDHVTKTIK